ncbi:hypothetical protein GCM10010172_06750 [Paractinoplanes ferrugineus]|uniref:HK97 gp10 family phage protein n=1 Tax=Paractinoplanes ferrugineus TaxID=113564 RepID=A0A919JAJ7_9ACTN|nr:hypothetical protein [Actinoplanes ferrugineus]GIE16297.1 hypothetical protein Afe05nite_81370 [Actinoplanes ferrugineus]
MARDSFVQFEPLWEQQVLGLSEPFLEEAAAIVEEGQKRRIPVSRDGSHGRERGYARDQIHVERGRDAIGPYRDIGSDAESPDGYPYPLGLETGTVPHDITAKGDYPLRSKDGRVFGKTVHHPGTKPMPWCVPALADLAGRVFQ